MNLDQPSKKTKKTSFALVKATTAAVKASTSKNVSVWNDPVGYVVTEVIFNCVETLAQWFAGNIIGKQVLKLLGQEAGGLALGAAGLGLGALIGTLICPGIGTAIGAGIGGIGGYKVGKYLTSRSKAVEVRDSEEVAVKRNVYEKALNEFELAEYSSNQDVENNKRRFALAYHPDKNIGQEKWACEQFNKYMGYYAIIKAYRTANGLWGN